MKWDGPLKGRTIINIVRSGFFHQPSKGYALIWPRPPKLVQRPIQLGKLSRLFVPPSR